ncbi:MAG: hypothetical protein J3Q66DRAFT_348567 [Benniella sp.]|nr:MAG: hypothetical protein J3Q66DRAFT_348567 [Benniella sp.]
MGKMGRKKKPCRRERGPLMRERGPLVRKKKPSVRKKKPLVRKKRPLVRKRGSLVRKRGPLMRKREGTYGKDLIHPDLLCGRSTGPFLLKCASNKTVKWPTLEAVFERVSTQDG